MVIRNAGRSRSEALKATVSLLNASVPGVSRLSGVVSALPDSLALAVNGPLVDANQLLMNCVSDHADLADNNISPYRVSPTALRPYDGAVIQNMFCRYFNYTRVIIFAELTRYGERAGFQLAHNLTCQLSVLSIIVFPSIVTDMTPYISAALQLEGTVYAYFGGVRQAALLLEQGYYQGLFMRQSQIFATEQVLNEQLWSFLSPAAHSDIKEIMNGMVVIKYVPDYELSRATSQPFITRWRTQAPTAGSGAGSCVGGTDNSDSTFSLYETISGQCMGFNFSTFNQSGKSGTTSFARSVTTVYDGVVSLALGLNYSLRNGVFNSVGNDATVLRQQIIDFVEFGGASGNVDYSPGNYGFSVATRAIGVVYELRNFYYSRYQINRNASFMLVGHWSSLSGVVLCENNPEFPECHPLKLERYGVHQYLIDSFMPYYHAQPPEVIKIGLLIHPLIDPITNKRDLLAIEALSAALMAVRNLNNYSDGILDNVLGDSEFRLAVKTCNDTRSAQQGALELAHKVFGGTGVKVAILVLENDETGRL